MSALIIIDLQKEFFEPDGIMGKKHFSFNFYKYKYDRMLAYCIQNNINIYWIQSDYSDAEDDIGYKTHNNKQRPCCYKNTQKHELIEYVQDKVNNGCGTVVAKRYYSCFHKNDLLQKLADTNTKILYFAGLTITTCVSKSIIDAQLNGFDCNLLEDLVITDRQFIYSHTEQRAFTALEKLRITITNSNSILNCWGEGDVRIVKFENFNTANSDIFVLLQNTIKFYKMYNRSIEVPRLVAIQSIEGVLGQPHYRHPNDIEPPNEEMSPLLRNLMQNVELLCNYQGLNHALIQLYRDGSDNISSHSDKTLDLDLNTPIFNVSFGCTRSMVLINKTNKEIRERIVMNDSTILVFGLTTNKKWTHEIKKASIIVGERISITFRRVNTFISPVDGIIRGQGSKNKTLDDNYKGSVVRDDMLTAFIEENNNPEFNWQDVYGEGFC